MRQLCFFLLAATLGWFGTASPSNAADHIQDKLGLFSEQATKAANQQIDQLYNKHGWMIAVETRDAAETIPDLPKEANQQDKFLTSWTTKNYVDNKLKGIYLVIFKNPNKFRFHIDTDQKQRMGVTQADINNWSNMLGENLRVKDFDAALLTSVGAMSNKLSRGSGATKALSPPAALPDDRGGGNKQLPAQNPRANQPEAEGPSILMWVLIAVGVFIIFRIVRSAMGAMSNRGGYNSDGMNNQYGPGNQPNMGGPGYGPNGPGSYGAPGYGGRGGGFMSGMLGGLFGGMAGNWMYDQMRGPSSPSSSGGQGDFTSHDASRDSYGGSLPDNSAESDSTTYGGDWGSSDSSAADSGGGDWGGGGDFGGGDFGGGDGGGDW